jgi:type II secretory pathway predicted ATPase ExeA
MATDQSLSEARLTDETLAELGLTEQPFLENKKFGRFSDSTSQKIRAALEQNLRFGDSVHLFVGEKGVGKSVFLSQLLKHCKNNIKPFVAKGDENFESVAFLAAVLNQLSDEQHDAESVNDYVDALVPLFETRAGEKMSVVLAIDDAHMAPIEEIAELINLMPAFADEDNEPTARLLLTGDASLQTELDALADEFDEGAYQPSVTTLLPLDETRISDYLSSRLKQAGHADAFPFTDKAIAKIYRESEGLPVGINASAANYLNKVYTSAPAKVGGAGFLSALGWPLVALGTAAVGLIAWGLSMFFTGDKPDSVVTVDSTPVVTTEDSTVIVGNTENTETETVTTGDTLIVGSTEQSSDATDNSTSLLADNSSVSSTRNTTGDTAANILVESTEDATAAATTVQNDLSQGADQLVTVVQDTATNTGEALQNTTAGAVETVTEVVEGTTDQATNLASNVATETANAGQQAVNTGSDILTTVNETVTQRTEQMSTEPAVIVEQDTQVAQNSVSVDTSAITSQGTATALPESVEVIVSGAANTVAQPADSLLDTDTDAASVQAEDNGGIAVPVQPQLTDSNGVELNVEQPDAQIQRAVENERWVLFQEAGKFTVQLATSRERGYIIDLAQSLPAQDPVAIYPFLTTNSKNPVFGLLSGLYNTREEAVAAVANMDPAAKQFGVWIRPIGDLQTAIKARR